MPDAYEFVDINCIVQILTRASRTILQTILNNLSKEVGSTVTVGSFFRMEVGEGIQR